MESQAHTFALFPKLPSELRREIWLLALPTSRLLVFELDPKPKPLAIFRGHHLLRLAKNVEHIPMLYAPHESRSIAREKYLSCSISTFRQPFYFSPKTDIIFLDETIWNSRKLDWFGQEASDVLNRQDISTLVIFLSPVAPRTLTKLASRFTMLQELIICISRAMCHYDWQYEYFDEFKEYIESWAATGLAPNVQPPVNRAVEPSTPTRTPKITVLVIPGNSTAEQEVRRHLGFAGRL